MKTTEIHKHRIQMALNEASTVLREIKQKTLKGEDLKAMKTLEAAVQSLEAFGCMIH